MVFILSRINKVKINTQERSIHLSQSDWARLARVLAVRGSPPPQ